MNIKNQTSTKSAEKASFPEENLQETENDGTFASSEEPQETMVKRTVRFRVEETGELFNDNVRIYTIELPCFKGKTEADSKTRIEKWVYNLANMEDMTTPLAFQDEMPVFKRLATVAEYANMTPAEQARYDYELKQYRDHYAQMSWAIKKSLMKGASEERIKIAIAMKKNGASVDFIVKCLGMTPEEVEALPVE